MFKLTYIKEFDFKTIKKYKFVIGLLLATATAVYSNTLDVPVPPPDPIVIEKVVVVDKIIPCDPCPKSEPCPEPIVCPDCPESVEVVVTVPVIEPELEMPAWYLGGNGDDKDDRSTDDNGNGDNGCDGHGSSHGGHGGHGQGHGQGHK